MTGYERTPAALDHVINIDEKNNILFIKKKYAIKLTFTQTLFFKALLQGVTRKDEIIERIWGDNERKKSENNYHQLIFQTRRVLKAHTMPDNLIITIPRHGVRLNTCVLMPVREFKLNRLFRFRGIFS